MVYIASCESRYRQFNADGSVLLGEQNPLDTGIFQINKKYHLEAAIAMGYDINTVEGNIMYAKYLYDTQGTKPWLWSREQVYGTKGWAYGECK